MKDYALENVDILDNYKIKVKKMHPDAQLPKQANSSDAGYDLVAIDDGVYSNKYIEYDTGLSIEPPEGYHTEIYPRSSISKYDLILANGIGLVDYSYRGNIKLRFKFTGSGTDDSLKLRYKKGDKIGQLVIRKTEHLEFIEVNDLSETERGTGGFGSTDKK